MITVMTFNLRYGTANDGRNRWPNRRMLALGRIRFHNPDLLGLQECRDDDQAEFVKSALPDYTFYGVRRATSGDTALEMAPVLFRRAAFTPIDHGHFWLSETPDVAGSQSWDSVFARTVTWARLIHRETGRTLIVANTHFDYQPMAVRESAGVLSARLSALAGSTPVIATGDFNADKNSPAYRALLSGGLGDAFRQAHPDPGDEATFNGFGQAEGPLPIDWVLISSHFVVSGAQIDRTRQGGLFPSDHDPVVAALEWDTK